ncbi:hypothetical protein D9M70_372590 [compost metagenome]
MKVNKFVLIGFFALLIYIFLVFDVVLRRFGVGWLEYIMGLSFVVLIWGFFVGDYVGFLLWSFLAPVVGSFVGYGFIMVSFLRENDFVNAYGVLDGLFIWVVGAYIANRVWLLSVILQGMSVVFLWFDRKKRG